MTSESLSRALDKLKELRGSEEHWRKQIKCLLKYLKENADTPDSLIRLLCFGEQHTTIKHQPAVLVFSKIAGELQILTTDSSATKIIRGFPDCFRSKAPQLLYHELEVIEGNSVVVKE